MGASVVIEHIIGILMICSQYFVELFIEHSPSFLFKLPNTNVTFVLSKYKQCN